MQKLAIFALALTPLFAQAQAPAQNAGQVKLNKCLVSLIDGREREVPALEPGQIVSFEFKEGNDVEAETVLGYIDDKQVQAQKEQRMFEVEVAREQAENDVNVQFAKASLRVAEQELKLNSEANRKVPGSVTQTELVRLALNVEKTRLQILVADMEQRIAGYKLGVEKARLKETEGMVSRREIKAPISGRIVELVKHRGEWCEPGAVVLKMVQLDPLRVEGFVNSNNFGPDEVANKPVVVSVRLPGNKFEQFQGRISYVDPRVQAGGEYRVYAEVKNRRNRADTDWLMRPGTDAEMTINLRAGLAQDTLPAVDKTAQSKAAR